MTTTGFQHYDDPVTLIADVTLTNTSTTLAIDLASTVDGAHNLTVDASGINAFEGAVGGTTPLTSLTTGTTGTTDLGGNVTTTSFQHYDDPVTLTADVTLTNTSATLAIDLASTVDEGAQLDRRCASGFNAFEGRRRRYYAADVADHGHHRHHGPGRQRYHHQLPALRRPHVTSDRRRDADQQQHHARHRPGTGTVDGALQQP